MKVVRTSQLSRIAQSPAATDLRGGKTSEVLSTVRRNNLAAEDAVSFQSDLFLDAATFAWTGSEIAGSPVSCFRASQQNGVVHIPSVSPSREVEGGVAMFPTSDSGWGRVWPVLSPPTSSPSLLGPLSVWACESGRRRP